MQSGITIDQPLILTRPCSLDIPVGTLQIIARYGTLLAKLEVD